MFFFLSFNKPNISMVQDILLDTCLKKTYLIEYDVKRCILLYLVTKPGQCELFVFSPLGIVYLESGNSAPDSVKASSQSCSSIMVGLFNKNVLGGLQYGRTVVMLPVTGSAMEPGRHHHAADSFGSQITKGLGLGRKMSLLQSTDLIYQLTSLYLFATHRFPADCHCWFSGHLCFIGFGFKSRFFNYQSFQIILNFYAIVRVCFKLIIYQ